MNNSNLYYYILSLGDNAMILGHRLSELCGHGPTLETDIALTNISLDLFGEVRNYFQYAAELKGDGCTEDDIAHKRTSREFYNSLLLEQPNTNFAYVISRQFLFDVFHKLNLQAFLQALTKSNDKQLKAIAVKSLKEAKYHVRFSSDWVRRLGDGTKESHAKIQQAVDDLYLFTGELLTPSNIEKKAFEEGYGTNLLALKDNYFNTLHQVFTESGIRIPELPQRYAKGKEGFHSEYLDYILQEFQYMQTAYPNMQW